MKLKISNLWIHVVLLAVVLLAAACSPPAQSPVVFDTPEAAVAELARLIEYPDDRRVEQVFGPGSLDLFRSGDENADREDFQRVGEMIAEQVEFVEHDDDTLVALFGESEWSWPIPLVRDGEGWRFATEEGRDELLNRRVGHNELWTLTSLHEIVDAQREYRVTGHDGLPPAYAQRFRSSEGKQDGLYWPVGETEDASPLGEFLADSEPRGDEQQPFHGYHYRMLLRRGAHAPGGEMEYTDGEGLLTHGFGVIAWPAQYGRSGVMTFITNQRGLVYQKDLGPDTEQLVDEIDGFDPGPGWSPTPDSAILDDTD